MTILVITTGGTIGAMPVKDPRRVPKMQVMPTDGRDFVCEALAEKFASFETRCVSLEPRDSKLIDNAYRHEMAGIIETAPEKRVLITQGTDALIRTADYLYRTLDEKKALKNKAVIFTGAMTPLTNGDQSDGYQNLAFALETLLRENGAPAGISLVFCDFENPETESGTWKPRLYPFAPGTYRKKFHASDDRFCRIEFLPEKTTT